MCACEREREEKGTGMLKAGMENRGSKCAAAVEAETEMCALKPDTASEVISSCAPVQPAQWPDASCKPTAGELC